MSNLKFKYNPTYNQLEATTRGKVLSISENVQTTSKGKEFYPATVEINGKPYSAMIHKANYDKGIVVGQSYLVNVVRTADRPDELLLTVSALQGLGQRATAEDFGLASFDEMMVEAEVGAEEEA